MFDPTLPANGSQILSAELRAQFNALKDIIDTQGAQIADLQDNLQNLIVQIEDMQGQINLRTTEAQVIDLTAGPVTGTAQYTDGFGSPPTQAELEAFAEQYNWLVNLLARV